jgi:hypothetical protein
MTVLTLSTVVSGAIVRGFNRHRKLQGWVKHSLQKPLLKTKHVLQKTVGTTLYTNCSNRSFVLLPWWSRLGNSYTARSPGFSKFDLP